MARSSLPFPLPAVPPPAVRESSHIAEIRPLTGGAGVAIEYRDAQGNVRMRFEFDETVPFDDVLFYRKHLALLGSRLPPRSAPRSGLLGPRLLPCLLLASLGLSVHF